MSYFSFIGDGPALPTDVLHALHKERLVFFCGAGISMPDLPDFRGLTLEAIKESKVLIDERGIPRDHDLQVAFRDGLYDKALDILERRVQESSGRLRQFVRERLTRPPASPDSLDLHKALLDLARLPPGADGFQRGYRLVTTNFDDRFVRASPSIVRWVRAAPLLARPSPDSLRHVVFLHGRIETEPDPQDPRCLSLVLTSADFGDAYLRDGYAARFVLELFAEFTVLFIGYGLNDPVMRYLMDAFAAERARGGRFRDAYAFASDQGDPQRQEALWRSKSVIPILYRKTGNGDAHSVLKETIVEWARRHNAGLAGHRAVFGQTIRRFEQGKDDVEPQDHLGNLHWTLAQNDGSLTEQFYRYTEIDADGTSHHPNISWLGPLLARSIGEASSSSSNKPRKPLTDSNTASFNLARWAIRNLEDILLVEWITKNEVLLRGECKFARQFHSLLDLELQRTDKQLSEPFLQFWHLMLLVLSVNYHLPHYAFEHNLRPDAGHLTDNGRIALCRLLSPALKWPTRPWQLSSSDGTKKTGAPERLSDIANFEVSIGTGHIASIDLPKLQDRSALSSAGLIAIADQMTSMLATTCDLGRVANQMFACGYSQLDRRSITSSDKDFRDDNWTKFVDLLIEAFEAAAQERPYLREPIAVRWLCIWRANRHAVFLRLYLFAITSMDFELKVDIFAQVIGEPSVLWSDEIKTELLRLFEKRGRSIVADVMPDIVEILMGGPPRVILDGFALDRQNHWREVYRAERLSALARGGVELPPNAISIVTNWESELVRDTTPEPRRRIAIAELVSSPTEIVVEQLQNRTDDLGFQSGWQAGQDLAAIVRVRPDRALEIAEALHSSGETRWEVWVHFFGELRERSADPEVASLAPSLIDFLENSIDVARSGRAATAEWVRSLAEIIGEDALFWRAFAIAMAHTTTSMPVADEQNFPSLTDALNSSCGILTEAALKRRWWKGVVDGEGLGSPFAERLSSLVDSTGCCGEYARVMCMPWLARIFWLDGDWTRDNIIEKMKLDSEYPNSSISLWKAFLYNPVMSQSMLLAMKQDFIRLFHMRPSLGGDTFRSACYLFADIVVARAEAFSESEIREALYAMGAEGVSNLLRRFNVRLQASENAPALWTTILQSWLQANWPSDAGFAVDAVRVKASDLLLATREAFPIALKCMIDLNLVARIEVPSFLLLRLSKHSSEQEDAEEQQYDYVTSHPQEVCRWLSLILPPQLGHDCIYLQTILERVVEPERGTPEHERWRQLRSRCTHPV